jgi:hypothetical protein
VRLFIVVNRSLFSHPERALRESKDLARPLVPRDPPGLPANNQDHPKNIEWFNDSRFDESQEDFRWQN